MNRSKRSKGFSMIEVLIALVILSVSLLGLAGLMVTTTRGNSFGNHMTEAVTFAQDKLEELRVKPLDSIVSANDPAPLQGSTGMLYSRSWTVSTLPNPTPPPTDLQKAITVTVRWNNNNNSIRLLSVVSD